MKKRIPVAVCLAAALLFSVSTAVLADDNEGEIAAGKDTAAEEAFSESAAEISDPESVVTEEAVSEPVTESPATETIVTEEGAVLQLITETSESGNTAQEEITEESVLEDSEEETFDGLGQEETPVEESEEDVLDGEGNDETTNTIKLEWTVTNVSVTCDIAYSWDSENLEWVETKTYSATDGSASFTFINYSDSDIQATVSFAAADGMSNMIQSAAFSDNNGCTVKTADGQSEYTESDLKQTITSTVTVNADQFEGLSATDSSLLGTYTVTIAAE